VIEKNLYNLIIENVPILCVDGFIISDNKILLLKRNNYPAFGEWWVPGGRVLKNEELDNAILRKMKDETNLNVKIISKFDIYETIFDNKHTVNVCYLLSTDSIDVHINCEHSEYFWFQFENLPELDHRISNVIKKLNYYENISGRCLISGKTSF
jgi:ADP-ribose pyrophosphatase YjhB (NUDIX family)